MYKTAENKKVDIKFFALHFTPFAIALAFYIYYISVPQFRQDHSVTYFIVLYSLKCISWAGYPLVILFKGGKALFKQSSVFKYFIVALLMLVSFMVPLIWSSYQEGLKDVSAMSSLVIAFVMLQTVSLSYNYMLSRALSSRINLKEPAVEKEVMLLEANYTLDRGENKSLKEEKENSELFKAKIDSYLALEKYYDANFNLEQMAKDLNVPKSIISKYFVQEFEQGFVKTVNSWRIARACKLLTQPDFDQSMEELAFCCGFNSRASFYRNFSQEKGCTPTVYRERSLR